MKRLEARDYQRYELVETLSSNKTVGLQEQQP